MANRAVTRLMQTSATGRWINSGFQPGFTLLEVMVTLVLIGIFATFAMLSLRGSDESDRLAEEVQRLSVLLQLNRDEALLRGEQRGIRFSETGYTFMQLSDAGEWQPVADTDFKQTHELPPGISLALWVDNRSLDLDEVPAQLPQVVLLSSGETTEFRVAFNAADSAVAQQWLACDLTGKLKLESTP